MFIALFQDVSCNEISHLPSQIGDLRSLRSLNVRRNLLIELPTGELSENIVKFYSIAHLKKLLNKTSIQAHLIHTITIINIIC